MGFQLIKFRQKNKTFFRGLIFFEDIWVFPADSADFIADQRRIFSSDFGLQSSYSSSSWETS